MTNHSFPSVSAAQMAEVDRLMIQQFGIQLIQMMENAGRNLTEQANRMLGAGLSDRRIVVLCGTGNNGGGGMAAARHLHNRGAAVTVALAGDRARLKQVPALQLQILEQLGLGTTDSPQLIGADLLIDALIGYGLRGEPRPETADWIEQVNRADRPVLALDLPSGLNPDSGQPASSCVRATATLTLALPKTGLSAPSARPYVGELYVADIGVPPELLAQLGIEAKSWFESDAIVRVN